jgi:hypothetical protein
MKINKNGFAIYLVVFFTAAIGFIVVALWHRSSLSFDIAHLREEKFKNMYAVEIALNYGVACVKQNEAFFFSPAARMRMPFTFDVSFLLKNTIFESFQLSITIKSEKKSNELQLHAFLKKDAKVVSCMKCLLTHTDKKHSKEPTLVVDHITLGTSS